MMMNINIMYTYSVTQSQLPNKLRTKLVLQPHKPVNKHSQFPPIFPYHKQINTGSTLNFHLIDLRIGLPNGLIDDDEGK